MIKLRHCKRHPEQESRRKPETKQRGEQRFIDPARTHRGAIQRGANRPAWLFARVRLSTLLYVSFEPNAVVKFAEIIRDIGDCNCLTNAREIARKKLLFIELIQEGRK